MGPLPQQLSVVLNSGSLCLYLPGVWIIGQYPGLCVLPLSSPQSAAVLQPLSQVTDIVAEYSDVGLNRFLRLGFLVIYFEI